MNCYPLANCTLLFESSLFLSVELNSFFFLFLTHSSYLHLRNKRLTIEPVKCEDFLDETIGIFLLKVILLEQSRTI